MTTTALPRPQAKRWPLRRWIVGVIVIIVVIVVALLVTSMTSRRTGIPSGAAYTVTRGNIIASVAGSGSIDATQALDLSLTGNGSVAAVLVHPGDQVVAGQPLARLDDRQLQIQLASAQAGLASAQAKLDEARNGNARPEDIAAAQAQVAQAQANYDKLKQGPSTAELGSARAAVSSALAAYQSATVSSGTSNTQLASAQAALDKATEALNIAQQQYNRWSFLPNISGTQYSQNLQNATIDYQQAQANYAAIAATAGPDAKSKILAAAAQLAGARASLDQLQHPYSDNDLAAAQAAIDVAKANLAKLSAPATATDLAIQQAAVTQAQQAVATAQINLDNATLRAPFAATVSAVNIVPGSPAGATGTGAAISIVDPANLHVDLKLSENDAARVQAGQPVTLSIDSLSGKSFQGTVTYISPAAQTTNNVVTYAVRIGFKNDDPDLKVGMTANVVIVTAQRQNVLMVPNTALLPQGNGHAVRVLSRSGQNSSGAQGTPRAQGTPGAQATPGGARQRGQNGGSGQNAGTGVREVPVEIGVTDGTYTEITSGLREGDTILALPASASAFQGRGGFLGIRIPGLGGLFGGGR